MRIERLTLERYGHFTDHEIEFGGDEACLHVVVGANEAGKTTALNALGDLLFGIDARSPYNFRHDYKNMRIGAVLHRSDGRRLSVHRRKGNRNTLLDDHDRPLEETALAPFLGGADRLVFDGLFGLTHESLRNGGNDMLAAEGDLGRMLFEAGSSMRDIAKVLDALNAEAGALFNPGRRVASKPFHAADNARAAAERDLREATLTYERWRQAEGELRQAEAEREDVSRRLDELEARCARLQRIRRTLSRLGELRQIEADLEELADAPVMPDDARRRLDAARTGFSVASRQAEREQDAAAAARAGLTGLIIPGPLLAAGDDLSRLYDRRGAILDSRNALPELQVRRDELEAGLRRMRTELSRTDVAVPGETALAEVRALIERDGALANESDDVRERRDHARAELVAAEAALAAAPIPLDLERLSVAVDQANCAGDLEAGLADADRAAARANKQLAIALSSLRLWNGDAAELAALAVPERETVHRFEREIGEAQTQAARARDALAIGREALRTCEGDLAALVAAGDLPTREAIAALRDDRDRGWRLIRRVFIDGEAVTEREIEAFAPMTRLADRFERLVADTDRLADRRQAEAERLAKHEQLVAAIECARSRGADLAQQEEQARLALAALQADWRNLWLAIDIEPEPPREMDRWLDRRDEVLRDWAAAQSAAHAREDVRDRLSRERSDLHAALESAGVRPGARASFAELVNEARIRLDSGRAIAADRALLEQTRKSQSAALEREQARLDGLAARRDDWRRTWAGAMERIGLNADTLPAGGAAALAQWDRIRRDDSALADADRRIARIQRDEAAFAKDVRGLVETALPELVGGGDPLAMAAEAFAQLLAARTDAQKKRDLDDALQRAGTAAAAARDEMATARAELDHLRALAKSAGDEDISAAIDRSQRKQAQASALTELKRWFVTHADGLSLDEALGEAEGRDPDAVQAEIAGVERSRKDLFAEKESLSERIATLRRQAAETEAGGAAAAEQARRNALADMEDCAERWMVTRAAAFLLRRGIEQFRQEQQGPLLARAESLFSTLTLGSFTRFRIDYDDADRPMLLGVRADGAFCPVTGMSDGTRDQLFLALRLAAIERYLGAAEPLPFIADDLFVHFDDARATAGLKVLIEFSTRTQVLLFTHHHHLAELARRAGSERQVRVHRLMQRAGSGAAAVSAGAA